MAFYKWQPGDTWRTIVETVAIVISFWLLAKLWGFITH